MSKILTAIEAMPASKQTVQSGRVDPERLEEFATELERLYPNAYAHKTAIAGAWVYDDGTRAVLYACKNDNPKFTVTVYRSGKAVFAGVEPITLPAE